MYVTRPQKLDVSTRTRCVSGRTLCVSGPPSTPESTGFTLKRLSSRIGVRKTQSVLSSPTTPFYDVAKKSSLRTTPRVERIVWWGM